MQCQTKKGKARGEEREKMVTGEVSNSASMLGITCWAHPTRCQGEEKVRIMREAQGTSGLK